MNIRQLAYDDNDNDGGNRKIVHKEELNIILNYNSIQCKCVSNVYKHLMKAAEWRATNEKQQKKKILDGLCALWNVLIDR